MTYNAAETGMQTGAPVELYDFARGAFHWYYTSADQDIIFESKLWKAATMQRGAIEQTSEQPRNSISLMVARNHEVADLWRVSPPSDVISLTVRRYHVGDNDPAVLWIGRVLNVEWSGSQATIHCEPASTSIARTGLRRNYQRVCPHVLYSAACGVDKVSKQVEAALTAVGAASLSAAAFDAQPDGYFAGGFVEWEVEAGNFERRFITGHVGADLTLSTAIGDALSIGDTVYAYPGCDHTLSTCRDKFSNRNNYGGFPFVPRKNPHGGTILY